MWLNSWQRTMRNRKSLSARAAVGRKRRAAAQRARFGVERLEARELLTVIITPNFAGEHVTNPGPGNTTLVGAQVYLIFADDLTNTTGYWNHHPVELKDISSNVTQIVNGGFLDGLEEYDYTGNAQVMQPAAGTYRLVTTAPVFVNSVATAPTIDPALADYLNGGVLQYLKLDQVDVGSSMHQAMFVVVTPPTIRQPAPGQQGLSGSNIYTSYPGPGDSGAGVGSFVWLGTQYVQNTQVLDEDEFTAAFSRQLADAVSGRTIAVAPQAPAALSAGAQTNEVADGEAAAYKVRLANGIMVEPYWSDSNGGAFIIPDGNKQLTFEKPIWSADGATFVQLMETATDEVASGYESPILVLAPDPTATYPLPAGNIAEFNNRFYRAQTDGSGHIFIAVSDNNKTYTTTARSLLRDQANNAETAQGGYPSLAVYNNSLYIAWTGTDSDGHISLAVVKLDNAGNPTGHSVDKRVLGYFSDQAPAIASYDNALFLAHVGTCCGSAGQVILDFMTSSQPQFTHAYLAPDQDIGAPPGLSDDKVNDRLLLSDSLGDFGTNIYQVLLKTTLVKPLVALPVVAGGTLPVDGYQYVGMNDNISLDLSSDGGVRLTLNGVMQDYAYGSLSDLVIDAGPGTNTISVLGTPANVPLTINALGNTTVNLGDAGSIDEIGGDVTIWGAYHAVNLTLDDSADRTSSQIELFSSEGVDTLTGMSGLSTIQFGHSDLSQFTLKAGYGQNNVTVNDTPDTGTSTNLDLGGAPNLDREGAVKNNNVYVVGTTGSLYINGSSAHDVVTVYPVGWADNPPRVSTINGLVNVSDTIGSMALIVDASNDAAGPSNIRLDAGRLTGLAAADIIWQPGSGTTGVTSVEVRGGSGADTYTVVNTSVLSGGPTHLETGNGTNTVNIERTMGDLRLDLGMGADSINVSPTARNLSNIQGDVAVNGGGNDSLTINDSQGTGPPPNLPPGIANLHSSISYTVTGQDVSRAASFTYSTPTGGRSGSTLTGITYQGITALELNGSNIGAAYSITSTAVPTVVNGGTGRDTFMVGQSLDSIGQLTVNGNGGNDSLKIDDTQGTGVPTDLPADITSLQSSISYTVTGKDVSRAAGYGYSTPDGGGGGSSLADITYQSIATLELDGSTGAATHLFTVASAMPATALSINGGGSNDTLVGPNTANTWAITGINSGLLNAIAFGNIPNLVGGTVSDAFRFSSANASIGTITGGAATLDYSRYTTGVNVNLGNGMGGTATGVSGTVTGISALIGGSANDTLNAGTVPNVALTGGLGTNNLSGTGPGDAVVESSASSYALTNASLTGTGGAFTDNLSGIEVASLTGASAASNAFTVSAWSGTGTLTAPAGTGTVAATKSAGFTLSNASLSSTDGMMLGLKGVTRANLTTSAAVGTPAYTVDASEFAGVTNLTTKGTVNAILFGGSASGSTLSATGSGNDVLIGGSGKDKLTDTGSGSNILIGGPGADTITGNGNDILIGGTTSYDRNTGVNIAALDAILAEWSSHDPYLLRINKISKGVGPGGTEALNASTCQSDNVANTMRDGSSPAQSNWFIVNPKDKVTKKNNETKTIV